MASSSFPGIGSGIDASGLAKSVYDQLSLSNVIRKSRVDEIAKQESSLDKFRGLLTSIASSLDSARTINGGAAAKSASSSDTTVVQATAGSGSAAGSFAVNVTSLASTATGSFNKTYSSGSSFLVSGEGVSGSFNVTVGTGDSATAFSVAVDETTTAQGFVDSFNSQAEGKANASLLNVGTSEAPSYKIVFSTANIGTTEGSLSITGSNDGVVGPGGVQGKTISQATNAQFTVSGVSGTIERESNNVSDVVAGVSLQLKKTGSATVTVAESASAAASKLSDFVSAFNDLVKFANTEDKVTSTVQKGSVVNNYGSLAKTNVDDDAVSAVRSAIASSFSDDGTTSLAALGVSTNRDGTLTFDQKKFEAAFNSNSAAANQAVTKLADTIGGTGGTVNRFTGYGQVIDQAINSGKSETTNLNDTMSQVERRAKSQEEMVLKQFQSLDKLSAQLSQSSSFISSLLSM